MHSDKAVEKVAADKCADCHHENVYECQPAIRETLRKRRFGRSLRGAVR